MTTDNILKLLHLLADDKIDSSNLIWSHDEKENLTVAAMCSDTFWWGCADAEEITDENIGLFIKTVDECQALKSAGHLHYGEKYCWSTSYCDELFAARVRKMRPQGASYELYPSCLWPLFNECGPERQCENGNPHKYPKVESDVPERFKGKRGPSCEEIKEELGKLKATVEARG